MQFDSSWGLWQGAEDDVAALSRALNSKNASLQEWKEYAEKLKIALDITKSEFGKLDATYVSSAGAEAAQTALKEAALKELARFDPTNRLLSQDYRKQIYDEVKSAVVADLMIGRK